MKRSSSLLIVLLLAVVDVVVVYVREKMLVTRGARLSFIPPVMRDYKDQDLAHRRHNTQGFSTQIRSRVYVHSLK